MCIRDSYNFNDRLSANGGGSVGFTKNNQTTTYTTAREKDARSQQAFLGTNYFVTNNDLLGASLSYNYKKARARYNGFIGRSFQLSYRRNLPLNQSLNLGFSRTANKYHASDALYLSTTVRKDFISSTSLSVGGPIMESTWSYGINLNWNDTDSNTINYITSGQTVGLSLTKQLSLF